MNFEEIEVNHYMLLIILFFLGGTIKSNIGAGSGTDIWLVYLIGLLVGILFAAMYYRVYVLHDFRSFQGILQDLYGRRWSKIFCGVYALYFIVRTDMVGQTTTEMANDILMQNAPRRLTVGILLFTTLYACHKGLRAVARSATIICALIGICMLPFLSTAFSSEAFSVENMQPFFIGSTQAFWTNTAAVCITPFTEIGLFAVLTCKVQRNQQTLIFDRMMKALVFTALLLILVAIINLSILGKYLVASLKYPFYNAMMLTGIPGVFERLDPMAVVIIVTSSFYKVTLLFYCWIEMVCALSTKINRTTVIIVTAAIIFFANVNISYLNEKFQSVILPFQIMPIFQVFFPLSMWVTSEVQHYLKRKRNAMVEYLKT